MSLTNPGSGLDVGYADILSDPTPVELAGPGRMASNGQHDLLTAGLRESLSRVATLAATALNTPRASVMSAGTHGLAGLSSATGVGSQQGPLERQLCADVVAAEDRLIIGDTRADSRLNDGNLTGTVSIVAWAGVPVHDQDGQVAGVLWVADRVPRQWSAGNIAVLETLAQVASSEVALRTALAHSSGRAALAQTLEESLLPPRLTTIPGLQVAARYAPGGTGAEVLGDFCDVFPSVGGTWGIVVGDVCGKGTPAAKRAALARYALRAVARRRTRPSLLLADLNQVLLDWPTDDPRFMTAIYAAVRPVRGGARVRISSAGHPLALVRTANGHVHEFGRPGALLGVLRHPELHDSQRLLQSGDSLILFSDGVTEARGGFSRDLYGDERLRRLVARPGDLTAVAMAETIQLAALTFSGGCLSDDTVVLVVKVPGLQPPGHAEVSGHTPLSSPGGLPSASRSAFLFRATTRGRASSRPSRGWRQWLGTHCWRRDRREAAARFRHICQLCADLLGVSAAGDSGCRRLNGHGHGKPGVIEATDEVSARIGELSPGH